MACSGAANPSAKGWPGVLQQRAMSAEMNEELWPSLMNSGVFGLQLFCCCWDQVLLKPGVERLSPKGPDQGTLFGHFGDTLTKKWNSLLIAKKGWKLTFNCYAPTNATWSKVAQLNSDCPLWKRDLTRLTILESPSPREKSARNWPAHLSPKNLKKNSPTGSWSPIGHPGGQTVNPPPTFKKIWPGRWGTPSSRLQAADGIRHRKGCETGTSPAAKRRTSWRAVCAAVAAPPGRRHQPREGRRYCRAMVPLR